MGTTGTTPNLDLFLSEAWGLGGDEIVFSLTTLGGASNVVVGSNPPYGPVDFWSIYPKFAGPSIPSAGQAALTGAVTVGSVNVANINTQGFAVGQFIQSSAFPNGTTIVSFGNGLGTVALNTGGTGYSVNDVLTVVQAGASGGQIKVTTTGVGGAITGFTVLAAGTGYIPANGLSASGGTGSGSVVNLTAVAGEAVMSQASSATGTVAFTVFVGPPLLPMAALNAYIALASNHLVQARWQDSWLLGMALFIAHFATLFLRSEVDDDPNSAAVAGLKQGITVAASANGVSQSLQPTPGLEQFAAWNQTQYGVQLATFFLGMGAGPMYLL